MAVTLGHLEAEAALLFERVLDGVDVVGPPEAVAGEVILQRVVGGNGEGDAGGVLGAGEGEAAAGGGGIKGVEVEGDMPVEVIDVDAAVAVELRDLEVGVWTQ